MSDQAHGTPNARRLRLERVIIYAASMAERKRDNDWHDVVEHLIHIRDTDPFFGGTGPTNPCPKHGTELSCWECRR